MKLFGLLIACLLSANVWGNDPFDRLQRQQPPETEPTPALHIATACTPAMLAADVPLHKLKLVGVMLFKSSALALFTDDGGQIYVVPQRAWFAEEGFQLEKISKNHVLVTRQTGAQCAQTETREIRF